VAENKPSIFQVVSGKFQLSLSLLAAQTSIFRKLFCDFLHSVFYFYVWLKMWRKYGIAAKNLWH